jgi:hypothetical protein
VNDQREPREPGPDDPVPGTEHTEETEERTETAQTGHSPDDAEGDVVTDPALDDRIGSDWADEGGATSAGPATDVSDDSD